MKKVLCFILIAAMMLTFAFAEDIDLSGLSFEELAVLRDRIQLEMMTRDEWQKVTVPQGLWEVGVDIPAGKWMVTCADLSRDDYMLQECEISWGKGKPELYGFWDFDYAKGDVDLYNPNNKNFKDGRLTSAEIEVEVGDFIYIDPAHNKAVFTPYTGKPSLGFK